MKTLHYSIIAGIIIIVTTSIGVFIEKIGENPQQPYAGITINGIKDNYTVNEPIIFSVTVEGYGSGCGDVKVMITKENDSQFKPLEWDTEPQCVAFAKLQNFKFNVSPANTSINQVGSYTVTSLFNDFMTHTHTETGRRISVISLNTASNQDTRVLHGFTNVTNTNFTINYDITENNKLVDANMDSQSKSLVLSLNTTHNGTLIVSIPRALLDTVKNARGEGNFIVLANGQEIDFKQIHTSSKDRTFSIQFTNGTSTIVMIATELI